MPERADRADVGYVVAWTERKTLTMQHGLAGLVNAGLWESETDGNPSVDADESSRRRLDRTCTMSIPTSISTQMMRQS
ncbi:MAG: hypothetical protein ABSD41_12945 [Candidatus Bathyarchaeia archaeon]